MNDMVKEQVSVIITTYRNEDYLSRAIESVLNQSYTNMQLIVVDDNEPTSKSRIATEELMESYPQVRYLKHPRNLNGAAARNTGIREATGEYIAFLDNDDVYFSTHIQQCVEALSQHPFCDGVVCGVVKVRKGMCWDIIVPPEGDMRKALFLSEKTLGTGSNLFARTEAVRSIHGFDEAFLRHQDVEFGIRLYTDHSVYRIKDIHMIKEMDSESNAPDFERFLDIKQQFMHKFRNEIEEMTSQEQREFYAAQFNALLYVACKNKDKKQRAWCVQALKKHRPLNKKECILVLLSKWGMFSLYEKIKTIIKIRNAGGLQKMVTCNLTEKDLHLFSIVKKGQ